MFETHRIKAQIDCRDLIERDLGRPKHRNNTYNTYKCPLHHESKGFSLVVYANGWHCFGKCGHGGDALAWLQEYHQLSFAEACEHLTSGNLPKLKQPHHSQVSKPQSLSESPDTAWQQAARKIIYRAMDTLWGKAGKRAWQYLEVERGLTEKTIVNADLGYIPGDYREWKTIEGLRVPCGITIPWFADGAIWGIKVRRAVGQQRYQQVAGGNIKGSLYQADYIKPGVPIFLTEGEFDALIAQQVGDGLISAAALGSAANKRINPRWFPKFITVPRILACMDADEAGEGVGTALASLSQAVHCVRVLVGKDVNEFYLQAGQAAVQAWIVDCLGETGC